MINSLAAKKIWSTKMIGEISMIKRLANHFLYYVYFYTRALNVSLEECDTIANKFKWLVVSQPFELQGYLIPLWKTMCICSFLVKSMIAHLRYRTPTIFWLVNFRNKLGFIRILKGNLMVLASGTPSAAPWSRRHFEREEAYKEGYFQKFFLKIGNFKFFKSFLGHR